MTGQLANPPVTGDGAVVEVEDEAEACWDLHLVTVEQPGSEVEPLLHDRKLCVAPSTSPLVPE